MPRFGLTETKTETEMKLSSYHGCWGCSITMVDCLKDFLYIIAGSGAREVIRNHEDGFLASWLFPGFTILLMYIPLLAIMEY